MLDFPNYEFSTLTLCLAIAMGGIVLFELLHYIFVLGKIVFYKSESSDKDNTISEDDESKGVSVVVVVNNNASALQEELVMFLEQNYPLFEVVVVNENSKDDTEFILHILQENYKNLKVVPLGQNANKFSDRKFSLSIGIRSAKYNTIVLTDITCKIRDFNWLRALCEPFVNSGKKILVGYSKPEYKKGLLNILARYYYLNRSMDVLGYGLIGLPFSADSNNMGYDKDFFFQKGGFISQYRKNCRQEDYFISRYANRKNTMINLNSQSFVSSPYIETYKTFKRKAYAGYISQKTYSFFTKFRLALLPLATLLLYLGLALLILLGMPWQFVVLPVLIKWVLQTIYYNKCSKKLQTKIPSLLVPFLEIYFMFFNFNMRIKSLFYRKKTYKIRWKNK